MAYCSFMSTTEQQLDRFEGKRSAAEQESEIPAGWKPSQKKPVPVMRCAADKKDGTRCKNWSIRGYTKCRKHAGPGALMPDGNVNKYAQAVIEAARLRLLDLSDEAVETIDQLIQPGTGESIRLKAATEVLDRAGIRGGFDVKIDAEITTNPSEQIAERLAKLAEGARAVQEMKDRARRHGEASDEVVDGEVLDDDDGQGALF